MVNIIYTILETRFNLLGAVDVPLGTRPDRPGVVVFAADLVAAKLVIRGHILGIGLTDWQIGI